MALVKDLPPIMIKYLSILFIFLFSFFSKAQNGCEEVIPLIISPVISPTIETNPISGNETYYDLCIGETLTLQASANLQENASIQWLLDEVNFSNLNEFTYTFNQSGGYNVKLIVQEQGCPSYNESVRIRVGIEPTITLYANPSIVCPGIVSTIGSDVTSDLNFTAAVETGGWESLPCEDEFAESTYLPDGSGVSYETSIVLDCFGESQVLENVNDIISVDINMEHSYTGDLDIVLTAPNGVQVVLFAYPTGSNTWLGQATDGDATEELIGVGYDYGWSMNPEYNGTMAQAITAGNTLTVDNLNPNDLFNTTGQSLISSTYLPVGNFNDFIGTPINGSWTITVTDNLGIDNGWIFSWGITINQDIIPSSWSFDNFIVDEYFLSEPSIIANTGNTISIQPEPGTYNYSYEVIDNFGCTFSEDISILATSYITTNPVITDEECGGEDGQIDLNILGGTPGYVVTWNSGLTGSIIDNLSAGTYFYNIRDNLGCEISGNESLQNTETGLLFETQIYDDHCDQGIGEISISHLNGSAPFNYNWSHSDVDQSFTDNLFEGIYQVNVTDNDGCVGELLLNVNNIPGPTAFFQQTFDTVTYVDGLVEFLNFSIPHPQTVLVSNQWSFGNGQFSNDEAPQYNFNQIGNYIIQLTVTDDFGCSDSYQREVVAVEDYFVWVPSAFTPNGDGMNDIYKPLFHNIIEESYELFIFDKWGKLVFETTDVNKGWDGMRIDNGIKADNSSYSFIATFITYRNELKKETGSFLLLK